MSLPELRASVVNPTAAMPSEPPVAELTVMFVDALRPYRMFQVKVPEETLHQALFTRPELDDIVHRIETAGAVSEKIALLAVLVKLVEGDSDG